MKTQRLAVLAMTATLFAGAALADEAGPQAQAVDSGAPAPHHRSAGHHAGKAGGGKRDYAQCMKEKAVVTEYFCNTHADACQAEKDGVARQCRLEARGVRQSG
jgi:hypothetical protein